MVLAASRPSTLALDTCKKQVLYPQIGFNFASGEVQAPDVVDEEDPNQPRKGWQAAVSRVVVTQFWDGLLPTLSKRDVTLLRSQADPLELIPFTVFPTDRSCRIDPQPFRILLLRRLRLPLPFTARSCVCGRLLDNLGHLGSLDEGEYPLEIAAARICREAGGRVRSNVFLREVDLGVRGVPDNKRFEVVVNGLPLFNGAQLAVDTTLVSPIRRDGTSRIYGVKTIDWENLSREYLSLIGDEQVISFQRTKVHVFSDSDLFLGKIHENLHQRLHGKID